MGIEFVVVYINRRSVSRSVKMEYYGFSVKFRRPLDFFFIFADGLVYTFIKRIEI